MRNLKLISGLNVDLLNREIDLFKYWVFYLFNEIKFN